MEPRIAQTGSAIAGSEARQTMLQQQRSETAIVLDAFGNPDGLQHDLGGDRNELCAGKRILLYSAFDPGRYREHYTWEDAVNAVAARGFMMDVCLRAEQGTIDHLDLGLYDQLWFLSAEMETVTPDLLAKIDAFVAAGKGLLIWADNDPHVADANVLAQRYTGSTFSGNDLGDRVLQPGDWLAGGRFIAHPLTEGLHNLYEGITICRITPGPEVTVLACSSDGYPCMATFDNGTFRIVLDTGFTKLSQGKFDRTAGTARYVRNIAFWLLRDSRPFTGPLLSP